jgi:ring-1,2-phenylacetyl-CoA epoxidase subunit PaaD
MLDTRKQKILSILGTVMDPEVPVLSVIDLGIVRDVTFDTSINSPQGGWKIAITPTYSGCPAMDVIAVNIRMALLQNGYKNIVIQQQLSPAWTTDWMSEKGKEQLRAYGIAAPAGKSGDKKNLEKPEVSCPLCHSINTKLISQFGSTACKALYQCNNCKEPFDYFKCH